VATSERKEHSAPGDSAKGKKKGPHTDIKSAALAGRLSATLTKAAGIAIVRDLDVAISALIAGFASRDSAVGVHITGDVSKAANFVTTFQGNLDGTPNNREMLLAQICARALDFRSHDPEAPPMKRAAVAEVCNAIDAKRMNVAIRECFDAKDYFESTDKASVAQAVREAMGDEHASKVAKMKSGDAAKFAVANVPKTGWLPIWLRTAHYDGPTKAAATSAKKTVKKAAKKGKRK
jgi:ParB family transcriptional regulator, chromosome partitioning protein